jgi:rubrerythrin
MRYLFQAAILVEEAGIEFYTMLAEKSPNQSVKILCARLASDEEKHKKLFQDVLSQWLPLPADQHTLNSLIRELKNNGLFVDMPSMNAPAADLIKYAIEQEKKTADFYLSFEKTFASAWKRMNIRQLVVTEREHANCLMTLYSGNI